MRAISPRMPPILSSFKDEDSVPSRFSSSTCATSTDEFSVSGWDVDDNQICRFSTLSETGRSSLFKLRAAAHSVIATERFSDHPETQRSYMRDRILEKPVIEQIDLDLPRTGDDPLVRARLGRIRAVLLRYAAEDPKIGYCQGMNFVAAAFTAASKSQSEAYRRFKHFVGQVRDLWTPGLTLLQTGTCLFEKLVDDRPWFRHVCSCGVDSGMYLPQAWLTAFAKWLPLETLIKCLELLEFHGFAAVLALTISILDSHEDKILQQTSFDGVLQVLSSLRSQDSCAKSLKVKARETLPVVFAMLQKPRESLVAKGGDKVSLEDLQNGEDTTLIAWTSSSNELLQWAGEESVAAGRALFRWAMSNNDNVSMRAIFHPRGSEQAHTITI